MTDELGKTESQNRKVWELLIECDALLNGASALVEQSEAAAMHEEVLHAEKLLWLLGEKLTKAMRILPVDWVREPT